jgi:NitT/TauT family transport system permease protein
VDAITKAFADNKGVMLLNMVASFKLPSILISLLIALSLGTVLGMNSWLRDALHPVLYTFSNLRRWYYGLAARRAPGNGVIL